MAQYTKAQLISASNATYFTNTSGGISASAVRDLNDSWISSSVLLSGSNTFIGSQIISGNVDITGTITASLQTGYLFVGDSSGRTQAVATSSIIANTDTGSLLVTGSVSGNTLTFTKGDASTFNLTVATGSTPNTGSFLTTASFASTNITFTKGDASQFSLNGFATTGSNTFRGTQTIETGDLIMGNGFSINAPSGNITNLSSATTIQFITEPPAGPGGTNDIKFYNRVSGSGILFINEQAGAANGVYFEAGNVDFNVAARSGSTGIVTFRSNVVAIDAASTPISASTLRTTSGGIISAGALTASLQQGYAWVGNASNVSTLVATSSFGTSIDTGSFVTTSSFNAYTASQSTGSLLVTGSVSGNVLTFTKADATTFSLTVATGSGGGSTDTGSLMLTGSVAGNVLTFTKGDASQFSLTVATGSGGGSTDTGSLLVTASFASNDITFTKGDATTFKLGGFATTGSNTFTGNQTISGSSGGGNFNINGAGTSNGQIQINQTGAGNLQFLQSGSIIIRTTAIGSIDHNWTSSFYNDINVANGRITLTGNPTPTTAASYLLGYSGSLVLGNSTSTTTYTGLSHLSSSQTNSNTNLIFKTNGNTGDTIISGSSNLFVNPAAVTAGFKRYIGGSGNIALNASNVPQISGSMGFSPTMNNNYFGGNSTTLIIRGPVSSSTYTISGNSIIGTVSIGTTDANHARGIQSGLTLTGNQIAGTLAVIANSQNLSSSLSITNTNLNGGAGINANSSSVAMSNNNINDNNFTLNNNFFSGSAGVGSVALNRNNIGGQNNTITVQGTQPAGTNTGHSISDNTILGGNNTIFVDTTNARVSGSTAYFNAVRNIIGGNQLIVSGSSLAADLSSFGSAYFGRYNANDGIRNKTSDIVFAVGTGNSTTRKTGFLIDSGSNSYFEGTLSVSGSSSLTGSLVVSSFTTLASVSSSLNFADDTAAAAGGVPLGGLYRNGNFVMIRLT